MSRGCLEWETSENRWREERKKKAKEPGSEIVIELKKKEGSVWLQKGRRATRSLGGLWGSPEPHRHKGVLL